jgi:helicase
MKVAGLFVGVSRLAYPGINELQFAHQDATALHAVFADGNLESGASDGICRLLTNDVATKSAVMEAVAATIADANAGRADLVVIHFSCHGSPAGALVMHDTERASVDETGIPIRELIDALSTVRERPVVLTLDCCFAGAALGMTDSPNRDAFNGLMHGFENQSRIVGCAAEFGQSAYEDKEYGKGLFSHALWSRLQEAFDSGERELSGFDWVWDAVQRTTELAKTRGRAQSATAFVTVRNSQVSLRIPRERPNQLSLIVPADLPAVTEDVASLAHHGLDAETINALRARLGPNGRLNQLQREAVEVGGVLRHQSVFVRAPTNAGKTLVAELAILGHQRTGRRAVVLLPLRALAREHARLFSSAYSRLNIRVIVSTGDAHDEDDLLLRGQFEVAFLTFEKFCAIISARPELRETLGLVVFDELQTIADEGRGHTLELLLVQVRRWRETSRWPQVIVLCGELADLTPLQRWLAFPVISSTHRPVPLEEAVIRTSSGDVRLIDRESGTERRESWPTASSPITDNDDRTRRVNAALPVVRSLLNQGMQVLVFCSEKPQARRMARRLAQTCGLPAAGDLATKLAELDASTDHRTRGVLLESARQGVGLHLADLTDDERNAVEDAFRSRDLKALVATSTLGQGVNLPADAVVFVDSVRWNGSETVPLSAVDYRNIAGRAGRLMQGGPPRGLSVLVAQTQYSEQDMWDRYITAPPASLDSSLGDLPNEDLVMLLLRQFETATVNDLTDALAHTYWAMAEKVDSRWRRARRAEMEESLGRLEKARLVERASDTEWKLTAVGRIAAGYGLSWHSATSIVDGAGVLRKGKEKLDSLALVILTLSTEEIQNLRCPRNQTGSPATLAPSGVLVKRPLLWEILARETGDVAIDDKRHKLGAIDMWLTGASLRDVEGFFARGANDEAVAGMFLHLLHRVTALLPAVAAIARLCVPGRDDGLREMVRRLTLQLSIGGGKHAAALHRLRLGLTRGECLKLVGMEVCNLDELREAVATRKAELAELLSTPRLQRLEALLSDRRHQARMAAPEPELLLEGFE